MKVVFPLRIWSYEHMHDHWTYTLSLCFICLNGKCEHSHLSVLSNGMSEANEWLEIKSDNEDQREAWRNSNSPVIGNSSFVDIIQLYSKPLWKQKQNDFTGFTVLLDHFTVMVESIDWAFIMSQALLWEPYIYISIYFTLKKKKDPGSTNYYYTHFKGKRTETHRGQVTSLRLHSRSWYLNITLKPMLFDTLNCFWFLSVKVLDLWLILESVIYQRHFSLFYSGCRNEPFDRIRIGHSQWDFQSGFISLIEAKCCVFYLSWTVSVQ